MSFKVIKRTDALIEAAERIAAREGIDKDFVYKVATSYMEAAFSHLGNMVTECTAEEFLEQKPQVPFGRFGYLIKRYNEKQKKSKYYKDSAGHLHVKKKWREDEVV